MLLSLLLLSMLSGSSVQIQLVSGGMVPPHAEERWQNIDLFIFLIKYFHF